MTSASIFAQLISCNGENGVHGGDPTTKNGSVVLMNFLTRLCTSGLLKSHLSSVAGSSGEIQAPPWPQRLAIERLARRFLTYPGLRKYLGHVWPLPLVELERVAENQLNPDVVLVRQRARFMMSSDVF